MQHFMQVILCEITISDNCGGSWGIIMAHFGHFLRHFAAQFPNGGREGYFRCDFHDSTIVGHNGVFYA